MVTADFEHLILDWNGTLIDDVDLAVDCVNQLRLRRGLPRLEQRSYRDAFGFPIRDFYARVGFDFSTESFDSLMQHYLADFNARVKSCSLHAGAHDLIHRARRNGVSVSLLSASHSDILAETLKCHDLVSLFDQVMGLDDAQAAGKIELAGILDRRLGRPGRKALMIGDTDHDLEVAARYGWQVAIVSRGHQSADRFNQALTAVFPDLPSLSALLQRPDSSEIVQRSEITHVAS